MEIKNKIIELNGITLDEIKKAFKEKLKFKFDHYNDLNTDKTIRRIKITGVFDLEYVYNGPDGGVNNHLQQTEKREEIISFLENELGIKGIEINRSGLGSFPKLVFKLKNK
jgi:hypothetical protein